MDENRVSGTARNIGGKIEEGVGALTGNTKTQIQGKLAIGKRRCTEPIRASSRHAARERHRLRPQQRGQRWANPQCGDRTYAGALAVI